MGDRTAESGKPGPDAAAIDQARYHAKRAAYYLGNDGPNDDPASTAFLDTARSSLRAALAILGHPVDEALGHAEPQPTVADETIEAIRSLSGRVAALEARVAALEEDTHLSPAEVAELADVAAAMERAASIAVHGVADLDDVG